MYGKVEAHMANGKILVREEGVETEITREVNGEERTYKVIPQVMVPRPGGVIAICHKDAKGNLIKERIFENRANNIFTINNGKGYDSYDLAVRKHMSLWTKKERAYHEEHGFYPQEAQNKAEKPEEKAKLNLGINNKKVEGEETRIEPSF